MKISLISDEGSIVKAMVENYRNKGPVEGIKSIV
jgi:hypothetical protein